VIAEIVFVVVLLLPAIVAGVCVAMEYKPLSSPKPPPPRPLTGRQQLADWERRFQDSLTAAERIDLALSGKGEITRDPELRSYIRQRLNPHNLECFDYSQYTLYVRGVDIEP
jgi:hypothetical protein